MKRLGLLLLSIRKRTLSQLTASNIIYEDNHIIILNKPSHVLSQGDYSNDVNVVDWLKGYLARKYDKKGNVYVGLIHRLDKGASGLIITTKTSKAASRLHDDMMNKRITKKYICIVHGNLVGSGRCVDLLQKTDRSMKVYHSPSLSRFSYSSTGIPSKSSSRIVGTASNGDDGDGDTDTGIKLVEAKLTFKSIFNFSTDYHHHHQDYQTINPSIISRLSWHVTQDGSTLGSIATCDVSGGADRRDYSVVEVLLDTGRKHQIRTQLSHLGHPIYGDSKYGGRYRTLEEGSECGTSYSSSSSSMGIALHAYSLAFTHPVSKTALIFKSEIPNNWRRHFHQDIINKIYIHMNNLPVVHSTPDPFI